MGFLRLIKAIVCFAYILWVTFSIKALVDTSDADIRHVCESSNLWACLITIVILIILGILDYLYYESSNKKEELVEAITILYCRLIVWAALTIWIGVELFNPCAIKSKPTSVYLMLLIHFCSAVVFFSWRLLSLMYGCICGIEESKETNSILYNEFDKV